MRKGSRGVLVSDVSVLFVLLVSVACVTALLLPRTPLYTNDANTYLGGAISLAEHHGYRLATQVDQPPISFYPPLNSLYLSMAWRLNPAFPDNVRWLNALMMSLSLLVVALTFVLFRVQNVPLAIAALGAVTLALSPTWMLLVSFVFSDVLFTALTCALMLIWLAPGGGVLLRGVSTGLVLALALLTRSAGMAWVVAAMILIAWRVGPRRPTLWLAVLLPPLIAALAWHQYSASGFTYRQDFWSRYEAAGGTVGYLQTCISHAWSYLDGQWLTGTLLPVVSRLDTTQLFARTPFARVLGLAALLFSWGIAALVAVGCRRAWSRVNAGMLVAVGVYGVELTLWPFPLDHRAMFPLVPLLFAWAWQGVVAVTERRIAPRTTVLATASFMAINLALNTPVLLHQQRSFNAAAELEDLQETCRWIVANVPDGENVAAGSLAPLTHLSMWTRRTYVGGDPSYSAALLSAHRARYLVVSPAEDARSMVGPLSTHELFRSSRGLYRILAIELPPPR